jgi:hypothetical protein
MARCNCSSSSQENQQLKQDQSAKIAEVQSDQQIQMIKIDSEQKIAAAKIESQKQIEFYKAQANFAAAAKARLTTQFRAERLSNRTRRRIGAIATTHEGIAPMAGEHEPIAEAERQSSRR